MLWLRLKNDMATSSTYYLDAPSLASATVVYIDDSLITLAPDGFYSDGVIVRQQVAGKLLPAQPCGSCVDPCGGDISVAGAQGVYYLNVDLGASTGAVKVRFDPAYVPDGIQATFNGIIYNGLSSPRFGYIKGAAGLPTYLGDVASSCDLPNGSPYILNEFAYQNGAFQSLGTTRSVVITGSQLRLTSDYPDESLMVIPKTQSSPSILSLEFIGPCTGTVFSINVSCPAPLTVFNSSAPHPTNVGACADTIYNITRYVAHVNGSFGNIGLYDLVYSDPNGEFKLAAGYYKIAVGFDIGWMQVDENGAVVDIEVCGTAYQYMGCGISNISASDACADAVANPKTLWSDCSTLAPGCKLYFNASLDPGTLVTSQYVKAVNNWDMDGAGTIVQPSSTQC